MIEFISQQKPWQLTEVTRNQKQTSKPTHPSNVQDIHHCTSKLIKETVIRTPHQLVQQTNTDTVRREQLDPSRGAFDDDNRAADMINAVVANTAQEHPAMVPKKKKNWVSSEMLTKGIISTSILVVSSEHILKKNINCKHETFDWHFPYPLLVSVKMAEFKHKVNSNI